MHLSKSIKVGIGFATGRKSFKNVLKTYIYNWNESKLLENSMVSLNLFIAYDLNYYNTKVGDYTNRHSDQVDTTNYIGNIAIKEEVNYLVQEKVIDRKEARLIFGKGYASKRNAILYFAIKQHMDYLIFLDDDEYPMAVTNTQTTAVWGGQHVLSTHLKHIHHADITHGHHCGYISPIPFIEFNDTMAEEDFRAFIEAISNDIINWDNVKKVMQNGGVTYADTKVLTSNAVFEVEEINHAKFISGANLCLNLTDPGRVFPFYNPPDARGEDTFLSTCLSERTVLRVPCYTFHDGFSTYNHLLSGVLPIRLKFITADTEQITQRFYKACIGWIRYKPLLLYITQRDSYSERIAEMHQKLTAVLPKVCAYFQKPEFMNVLTELETYHKNVERHYAAFRKTQVVWEKIRAHVGRQP